MTTRETLASYILKPFKENLEVMVILCLLSGAADCFFWTSHSMDRDDISPFFGCYMFLHSIILVYGVVLIYGVTKGILRRLTLVLLYLLGIGNLCIDSGVHTVMKCGFIKDFVAIVMGTNINESQEFISMYINGQMIFFITLILLLSIIVHYYFRARPKTIPNRLAAVGVFLIVVVFGFILNRGSQNWEGVFLMKIKTFLSYETTPDLRKYSRHYELYKIQTQPSEVVLIIGNPLTSPTCHYMATIRKQLLYLTT